MKINLRKFCKSTPMLNRLKLNKNCTNLLMFLKALKSFPIRCLQMGFHWGHLLSAIRVTLLSFCSFSFQRKENQQKTFRCDPILSVTPSATSQKIDLSYTNRRRVQAVMIEAYLCVVRRKKTLALQWFCLGLVQIYLSRQILSDSVTYVRFQSVKYGGVISWEYKTETECN